MREFRKKRSKVVFLNIDIKHFMNVENVFLKLANKYRVNIHEIFKYKKKKIVPFPYINILM